MDRELTELVLFLYQWAKNADAEGEDDCATMFRRAAKALAHLGEPASADADRTLKPCPFCDGEIYDAGGGAVWHRDRDVLKCALAAFGYTKEGWNRRALGSAAQTNVAPTEKD